MARKKTKILSWSNRVYDKESDSLIPMSQSSEHSHLYKHDLAKISSALTPAEWTEKRFLLFLDVIYPELQYQIGKIGGLIDNWHGSSYGYNEAQSKAWLLEHVFVCPPRVSAEIRHRQLKLLDRACVAIMGYLKGGSSEAIHKLERIDEDLCVALLKLKDHNFNEEYVQEAFGYDEDVS